MKNKNLGVLGFIYVPKDLVERIICETVPLEARSPRNRPVSPLPAHLCHEFLVIPVGRIVELLVPHELIENVLLLAGIKAQDRTLHTPVRAH